MTTATATRRHTAPRYSDEEINGFAERVARALARAEAAQFNAFLSRIDDLLDSADAQRSAGK